MLPADLGKTPALHNAALARSLASAETARERKTSNRTLQDDLAHPEYGNQGSTSAIAGLYFGLMVQMMVGVACFVLYELTS